MKNDMTITMTGKYALRQDPYEEVKILCVDRNHPNCVIAMGKDGQLHHRFDDGRVFKQREYHSDLVPLQVKPQLCWGIVRPNGEVCDVRHNEKDAHTLAESHSHGGVLNYTVIKLIPTTEG